MSFGGLTVSEYWNAATNTPKLVSGAGSDGLAYLVRVAGNTTLDGNTSWEVGDIVHFAKDAWRRLMAPSAIGALIAAYGGGGGGTQNVFIGTVQPTPLAGQTVLWVQTDSGGVPITVWLVS